MPNWCENEVIISGDKDKVKELVELMTPRFDYNRLIPMPEELLGSRSPAMIISQKEYEIQEINNREIIAKAKQEGKEIPVFSLGDGITIEMSNSFIEKYGYDNWYDWSVKNWGTKWNACRVEFEYKDGSDYAVYVFDSPWNPPDKVCFALRNKFPELEIEWNYNEEGMQLSGGL